VRRDPEAPLPAPLLILLAVLATIFVLPLLLNALGAVFTAVFGRDRVGRQVAMMVIAILGVPLVLWGYVAMVEHMLRHLTEVWQRRVRPWPRLCPGVLFPY